MPIPPGSDSEKEACHEGINGSCEQWQLTDGRKPCSCRDAETAKFDDRRVKKDVEGEETDESKSSKAQNTRRVTTRTSMEKSQMDDEGKEREEFRSSTAPNTRRRTTTKTSVEENKSDKTTVAVTTPRVVASMSWRQAAVQKDDPVQGEQRTTRPRMPMSL